MYASTKELLRTIVTTDTSLSMDERNKITDLFLQKPTTPGKDIDSQIISRRETRDRYFPNRSLKYIDRLSAAGFIPRVMYKGRQRSPGFRARDVEKFVNNIDTVVMGGQND